MSDCFVLYLLLTCMKKKTSGADKFTNNSKSNFGVDDYKKITGVQASTLIEKFKAVE